MNELYSIVKDLNGNKKNVFWGTGKVAIGRLKIFLSQGIKVDYLTDYDEKKWGAEIEGIKVISPYEIRANDMNIIIGSSYYKKIINLRIAELGFPEDQIFYDNLAEDMDGSLFGRVDE